MPRIPDELLEEIRARLPIEAVVGRQMRIDRRGRLWAGCCPFHGERTPSFCVYPRHYHCFGCGAHGDVIRFVQQTERCSFRQAVLRCAAEAGVPMEGDPGERKRLPPPPPPPPRDDGPRIARARRIWDETGPIERGSAVALYLASRHLWPLPEAAHAVLRAGRRPYPADRDAEGRVIGWPAGEESHHVMVARVDAPGMRCCAVHLTYLSSEGGQVRKLTVPQGHSAKIVQGALPEGAAIRLGEVAERMGCAEGIETALAATALTGLPVWATYSAARMASWIPPRACREVTIFADQDKPLAVPARPEGTGIHAARALQERLLAEGRAATIRAPLAPHGDYADVLAAQAERRAA